MVADYKTIIPMYTRSTSYILYEAPHNSATVNRQTSTTSETRNTLKYHCTA